MRITVDIDENTLIEVRRETGISKKSPAVGRALELFLREARKRRLIRRALEGKTDYSLTNDELEKRSAYDAD
jgi:Arc/MetJ family transcription regulator